MEKIKRRYEIAGLKIVMTTYYERTSRQAGKYLAQEEWKEEQADGIIDFGNEFYEKHRKNEYRNASLEDIEYIYTGALFSRILLDYSGCMLHSSAVVVDGYAYLFSADSGTGKSTHTGMWLKHFKERAYIINDDKPALRCIDGQWYVYGTPWSGKTALNENTQVKLGAIVFLERSENNWIEELPIKEAIPKFLKQTVYRLGEEAKMDQVLKNMENVLMNNSLYRMGCNISEEAVVTAYEKIRRI